MKKEIISVENFRTLEKAWRRIFAVGRCTCDQVGAAMGAVLLQTFLGDDAAREVVEELGRNTEVRYSYGEDFEGYQEHLRGFLRGEKTLDCQGTETVLEAIKKVCDVV